MIRIVKMEFADERIQDFIDLFEQIKHKIKNQEGCISLSLLQDKDRPNIFFTYSNWTEEKQLHLYRDSALFETTWTTIKPWFSAKPMAWSVDEKEKL